MTEIQTLAKAILDNPCIFSDDVIEAAHRAVTASHKDDDDIYQPWNPDGKEYYWVGMCGDVMHETGYASLQRENFNCFASKETAKRAAADAKIRNLFWQWKEQNDPEPASQFSYRIDFEKNSCDKNDSAFVVAGAPYVTGLFYPFSSSEKAHQFITDCKPYLDEYARAMGWMTDGD